MARPGYRHAGRHDTGPGGPIPSGTGPAGSRAPGARSRRGRIRRLLRHRAVRAGLALIAVLCCWAAFSIGQALTAHGGGSTSSKLAEWARDHYLGPVVTFGEWLSYSPPKVGGTPGFSLAAPPGSLATAKASTSRSRAHGFQPIIPARLSSPAGAPLPGEGAWRVLERVSGQPAVFGSGVRVVLVRPGFVIGQMTAGMPPAPLATTPAKVGAATAAAVRAGRAKVWIPASLGALAVALRLVPGPAWRRVSR